MKKITKLLALLLALLMTVSCFTACKKVEEKEASTSAEEKDINNEEEAVRTVVENFAEATLEKISSVDDFEDLEEYLDPDGSAYEEHVEEKISSVEELIEVCIQTYFVTEDTAEEFIIGIYNAHLKYEELEIVEVNVDEDTAKVEVEYNSLDGDEIDEALSKLINELGEEYVQEKHNLTWSNFVSEVLKLDAESQQEYFKDVYESILPDAASSLEDVLEELETETEEQTVTLEKIDGEWLITKIK